MDSVCAYKWIFVTIVALKVAVSWAQQSPQPNIIFILADDLGWNDVSFHGTDQIFTPNIDALAYNGVILNSHYVMPVCTPSRSALMTGLYPIHNGMQGSPIRASEPRGLPMGKLLPGYLKDLGYITRIIGKWHLGFFRPDFTPTYRGFDSHLGYLNGLVSYYDYVLQEDFQNRSLNGFDLRRNFNPAHDLVGKYATDLFTDEAVEIIRTHDKSSPLFMYMSHLAVHAGNRGKFLEAPQDVVNMFQHISDPNRRTFAAMLYKLDESVGRVVAALEEANMLQNSIIVFAADNGAPTIGTYPNWGSNYPLRGIKETLWEGGVRGATCIWSPLIKTAPKVSNDLMHVSDWLPTLYAAAGGNVNDLPNIDGVNQWPTISEGSPSERNEILLNIDEVLQTAAIRINSKKHHWKLVVGTVRNGTYDGYFGQGTNRYPENNPPYDYTAISSSRVYRSLERLAQRHFSNFPTHHGGMQQLRKEATVNCDYKVFNPKRCNPFDGPNQVCLYDIKRDPCEMNNLASLYPSVANYLFRALIQYRDTMVPQPFRESQPDLADPINFNGTWSPWISFEGRPYVVLPETEAYPNFEFDSLNNLGADSKDLFFAR